MTEIRFYQRNRALYRFLSNFSAVTGLELDGKIWPTSEHWYQAQKFSNPELRELIRRCERPGDAKRLARLHRDQIRPDWDSVKTSVMLTVLRAKFAIPYLRNLLLKTGTAELVEDSPFDSFWGIGHDGKGQNMLGRLLMQIREEVNHSESRT